MAGRSLRTPVAPWTIRFLNNLNSCPMILPNETKIKFCNAFHALERHSSNCLLCLDYLEHGDGDLCEQGQRIIRDNLYAADTTTLEKPKTTL